MKIEREAEHAGAVVALHRYPVKSMQGESVDSAPLDRRGVLGDLAYAVLDRATGHIASAKHPRKWEALFACSAAFVEPPRAGALLPPIWITLPDGAQLHSDDPECDTVLSRVLGRDVALITAPPPAATREADRTPVDAEGAALIRTEALAAAAPAGTFFDYAPLHILSIATLERLASIYPSGRWKPRRFRPNFLVELQSGDETAWLGRAITIGAQLMLYLLDPAPRCVVTTLAQHDLPRDPGILRTITQHSSAVSVTAAPGVLLPAVAGVYGVVAQPGVVRLGSPIREGTRSS